MGEVFRCVSAMCTSDPLSTPQKSNPLFRMAPPSVTTIKSFFYRDKRGTCKFSLHLPSDYRALYTAAPLAYYLGAAVEEIVDGEEPRMTFRSGEELSLPAFPELELWSADLLRRMFYLDCAVRYTSQSGKKLDALDIRDLTGFYAEDIFDMDVEERFRLYLNSGRNLPCLPPWHLAAYLDPVPESLEALPFLLHALSAIYMPECVSTTERGLVSLEVRNFLGGQKMPGPVGCDVNREIVIPALREAGTHLWFAGGYPVDAAKASAGAFVNRGRFAGIKKHVSIGIICNENSMEEEVDVMVEALSDTPATMQVHWEIGVLEFSDIFSRGYDIVQFIGHCNERGFKCSDGFASVCDIEENNTPVFFFNSCSSHREAVSLIKKGSVCGVAALFRVLEEAAIDVCRNFYLMLGEGYPVSVSINAARECSVLGKEYLLVGDGSYTCFEGDELKRFYRITRHGDEFTLGCTMSNVHKGYVVGTWHPDGSRAVSDLGFETRFISAEHLALISRKFKGFCLYGRNIYRSVEDAALAALQESDT